MKKLLLLSAALAGSGIALAQQEVGRVISSTPILEQVAVPRQVCAVERIAVPQHRSGAGAAIGAIAGGALGNAVGNGGGRTVATLIGIIGGAVVGNSVEGAPRARYEDVQRCETQSFNESRTVGYAVVYDYAGRRYSVQTPTDPGPTIAVNVSPVIPGAQPAAGPQAYGYATAPVVVAAPPPYYRRGHGPYLHPIGTDRDWRGYRQGHDDHP